MTDEPEKRGKGLTMPGNPALELQRMMLEEARQPVGRPEETDAAPAIQTNPSDNKPTNQLTNLPVEKITDQPTNQLTPQDMQPASKPGRARRANKEQNEARPQTPSNLPNNELTNQLTNPLVEPTESEIDREVQRRTAYARARTLGDTEMKVIGLKVPDGLNDYLDDYYHRHRKTGLKKQDLVKLALQWLVVHLEAEDRIEDLA